MSDKQNSVTNQYVWERMRILILRNEADPEDMKSRIMSKIAMIPMPLLNQKLRLRHVNKNY
jgi:hypothetical protein